MKQLEVFQDTRHQHTPASGGLKASKMFRYSLRRVALCESILFEEQHSRQNVSITKTEMKWDGRVIFIWFARTYADAEMIMLNFK